MRTGQAPQVLAAIRNAVLNLIRRCHIDVGARAAIYEVIAGLARSGMAVIIVSSDLEEVLGLAHRLLVLSRGRNRGILERGDADGVSVMKLATS